ncbi:hypothetical protein CG740_16730 [Streptomyces sp. CB01201]|nr:hypothetical protein CG740_16730 [Streptomyces sp. CB01201]
MNLVLIDSDVPDARFFGAVFALRDGRIVLVMPIGRRELERDAVERALLARVLDACLDQLPRLPTSLKIIDVELDDPARLPPCGRVPTEGCRGGGRTFYDCRWAPFGKEHPSALRCQEDAERVELTLPETGGCCAAPATLQVGIGAPAASGGC